jgi:hypothetical protein
MAINRIFGRTIAQTTSPKRFRALSPQHQQKRCQKSKSALCAPMYSALSLGVMLLFLGYACQPALPGVAAPMQTGDEGTTALELPISGLIHKPSLGAAAHRARACDCVPANGVSVWIELFGSNKKEGEVVRVSGRSQCAFRAERVAPESGRALAGLLGERAGVLMADWGGSGFSSMACRGDAANR